MFKAKIQKPTKLTKLEMKELKHVDTEEIRKKKERHQAHIETRAFFLESQKRANYRDEYDRLVGEQGNIPQVRRQHGNRVADITARTINRRHDELRNMYKQAFMQSPHEIDK